jgi:hypothetical protein
MTISNSLLEQLRDDFGEATSVTIYYGKKRKNGYSGSRTFGIGEWNVGVDMQKESFWAFPEVVQFDKRRGSRIWTKRLSEIAVIHIYGWEYSEYPTVCWSRETEKGRLERHEF